MSSYIYIRLIYIYDSEHLFDIYTKNRTKESQYELQNEGFLVYILEGKSIQYETL